MTKEFQKNEYYSRYLLYLETHFFNFVFFISDRVANYLLIYTYYVGKYKFFRHSSRICSHIQGPIQGGGQGGQLPVLTDKFFLKKVIFLKK